MCSQFVALLFRQPTTITARAVALDVTHRAPGICRKDILDRRGRMGGPYSVFRRNLGRDMNRRGVVAQHLSNQPFAVALAITERRIDEDQAQVDRPVERWDGLLVICAAPSAVGYASGSTADFGNTQTGATECSVVHGVPPVD